MSKVTKIGGVPVGDAAKPFVLHITRRDCAGGNPKIPGSCAAAKAIRREFDGAECFVHLSRVYIRDGKRWSRYRTPPALRTEIVAFDRGGTFQPGDYTLATPPLHQRAAKRTSKPAANKALSAKGRSRSRRMVAGVRPSASG